MCREDKYKNLHKFFPDGGMINCGKVIYKEEGFMGFWRGFSACTARAVIANSFMFMTYEFAQKEYKSLTEE